MIDIDDAYPILFANIRPLPAVETPLPQAVYRTLARPVTMDVDDPPFDKSVMDGYAVRSVDVANAPVTLRVAGSIAAGTVYAGPFGVAEAMQINTGAPIPAGADAVVRVEDTEATDDGQVMVRKSVPVGNFITPKGTNIRAGREVLPIGGRLTPPAVGAAAAAGAARVVVYRRPKAGVLVTGDEIVEVGRRPGAAQIRNSNETLLIGLIESAHAEAIPLGMAPDERRVLLDRIRSGLCHDLLCLTGGISMGVKDLVPDVLLELGAVFHFRKLAIKPGRPVIFATMPNGTSVFALPGNPASAFVGFEL